MLWCAFVAEQLQRKRKQAYVNFDLRAWNAPYFLQHTHYNLIRQTMPIPLLTTPSLYTHYRENKTKACQMRFTLRYFCAHVANTNLLGLRLLVSRFMIYDSGLDSYYYDSLQHLYVEHAQAVLRSLSLSCVLDNWNHNGNLSSPPSLCLSRLWCVRVGDLFKFICQWNTDYSKPKLTGALHPPNSKCMYS